MLEESVSWGVPLQEMTGPEMPPQITFWHLNYRGGRVPDGG